MERWKVTPNDQVDLIVQRVETMLEDHLATNNATNLSLPPMKPGKQLDIKDNPEPDPEEEAKKIVPKRYHGYIDIFSEEKAK